MFLNSFHTILLQLRATHDQSLRKLSYLTGISRSRLSRLELGQTQPTFSERQILYSCFPQRDHRLLAAPSKPSRLLQKFVTKGKAIGQANQPYFPPRDRKSRIRYFTAKRDYGAEMSLIENACRQRSDFLELHFFSEIFALGSGLECVYIATLLAKGAEFGLAAPYWFGPLLPHIVICPMTRQPVGHRPFPYLSIDQAVYFPQVSFATPRTYTVDLLVNSGKQWSVIEIDGRGHCDRADSKRSKAIGLSIKRLSESQVLESVRNSLGSGEAA